MKLQRDFAIRVGAVALLAAAAVALFVFSRSGTDGARPATAAVAPLSQASVTAVDHAVDSVLRTFSLDRASLRTASYPIPHSNLKRIEKRVSVPPAFSSIQVNHALNQVAREFGGRVVASENLKEQLVAMHVEMSGLIIETVILKTASDPPPAPPRRKRRTS
jgi:hypothetical protein